MVPGEATRSGGVVTPFEPNRPVAIDGVGIRSGDFVFADSSGAVVIPAGQVVEVVAEAPRIVAADAASWSRSAREDATDVRGDER